MTANLLYLIKLQARNYSKSTQRLEIRGSVDGKLSDLLAAKYTISKSPKFDIRNIFLIVIFS
jgi:hypothetical protein